MPLNLSWSEIALRLALAFAAGALIGFNRTEHGRPAGLRTTILVCLAACVAMLQVNLLLPLAGRHPDSFVMNDLMRFPLGILTGVGFIGGGAILRKGDMVLGVTTAATLWFVTVVGLCLGGGQLALGIAATTIGVLVLWVLRWLEDFLPRDQRGTLVLVSDTKSPTEEEVRASLAAEQYKIMSAAKTFTEHGDQRELRFEVQRRVRGDEVRAPRFLEALASREGVLRAEWNP
ncbi:MAG TPA: MgtC/SapB family protein [Terriglobales bacterium]|jgi:putative Mg2+ transporter-C (MgtC) family protein|nr:MgtC/SapB family protein [Terriglobales bacterium]